MYQVDGCHDHCSRRHRKLGDRASAGSMHEAGRSGLVLWDDPEGWDGKGGERMGNTCTPVADSCQCVTKTTAIL